MENQLMKRMTIFSGLLTLLVSAVVLITPQVSTNPAVAADQTITLSVDKMYCATCPLTVQAAIQKVPGVKSVKVDYKTKSAVVVFDAGKTTAEAVAAASTNVGYPAQVVKTSS
jgi:mercuric ion binding protein